MSPSIFDVCAKMHIEHLLRYSGQNVTFHQCLLSMTTIEIIYLPRSINPILRSDRILQNPTRIQWDPTGFCRIRSNPTGMYRKSVDGNTHETLVLSELIGSGYWNSLDTTESSRSDPTNANQRYPTLRQDPILVNLYHHLQNDDCEMVTLDTPNLLSAICLRSVKLASDLLVLPSTYKVHHTALLTTFSTEVF